MKKIFVTAALAAAMITSCEMMEPGQTTHGNSIENGEYPQKIGTLKLNIGAHRTRSTGAMHGGEYDEKVNTLDIFVFRNTPGSPDDGILDSYRHFAEHELGSLTGIEITAPEGSKTVVALANAQSLNGEIRNYEDFRKATADLTGENTGNFLMCGSLQTDIINRTEATVNITRMVARICVDRISTDFTGTPYEGLPLENVRLYLTNVSSGKRIWDGGDAAGSPVLNYKKYVSGDCAGCTMEGMLYDEISGPLKADSPHTVSHFFYCYENLLERETPENRFTRLVLQADLNGNTYYYPININRENYGHSVSTDHFGVKRNTSYTLGITIRRPGSTDPEIPVVNGSASVDIKVEDWIVVPRTDIIF